MKLDAHLPENLTENILGNSLFGIGWYKYRCAVINYSGVGFEMFGDFEFDDLGRRGIWRRERGGAHDFSKVYLFHDARWF